MKNIEKTINFVLELFDNSEYLKDKPYLKQYRVDHTFRVASIGKEISQKENLNVQATVIGCLLHDISYIHEFESQDDWKNHGRTSAKMARDFVNKLDIEDMLKHEILYGIAIHVDDKADFDGERTILVETIGECDNIDRFDKYRLYEALNASKLNEMTLIQQIEFCKKRIEGLNDLKKYVFKTNTSNKLWNEKLDYQITYFESLLKQLKTSSYKNLLD